MSMLELAASIFAAAQPKPLEMRCPRCLLNGRTVQMHVGHRCASVDDADLCGYCGQMRVFEVTCADERGSFSELQPCDCLPSTQARIARERGAR